MVYLHAAAFWVSLAGILLYLKNIYDYNMKTKEDNKLEKNYIASLIIQIIGFSFYFVYYSISRSSLSILAAIIVMADIFILFFKGANRTRFK